MNSQKAGLAFYSALGKKGAAARAAIGRTTILLPHEHRLMLQGRYLEAARMIYQRAYGNGWTARRIRETGQARRVKRPQDAAA